MRKIFYAAFILVFFTGWSQNEETEIMQPIYQLFNAMSTNDSALAASVFTSDAMLHTVVQDQSGNCKRSTEKASVIPAAYATPKNETWYEPIWNARIVQDGGLATVVVDYAFYRDKTFSHCGVDAFQLMKTAEGWKIFVVSDTRRKTDCNVPEEIKAKHEK